MLVCPTSHGSVDEVASPERLERAILDLILGLNVRAQLLYPRVCTCCPWCSPTRRRACWVKCSTRWALLPLVHGTPRVLVTTSNRGKSPLLIFTLNSCALDAKDGRTAQESIACNSVYYLYSTWRPWRSLRRWNVRAPAEQGTHRVLKTRQTATFVFFVNFARQCSVRSCRIAGQRMYPSRLV